MRLMISFGQKQKPVQSWFRYFVKPPIPFAFDNIPYRVRQFLSMAIREDAAIKRLLEGFVTTPVAKNDVL